MAIIAINFLMGTIQPEFRLAVIKVPRFPRTRVMAGFALRAKAAFVDILLFMATITLTRRIPEGISFVTFFAFCIYMTARKCKARTIVVELVNFPA
jgi:hypothetical protein